MLNHHFSTWVHDYQGVYGGFARLFSELAGRPSNIIETGTSAWGVDSTRLWDEYTRRFGGQFWSVDIRSEPSRRLEKQVGPATTLVVENSVQFLRDFAQRECAEPIDVFYLDSFDLDWEFPEPAERHCLLEWEALLSLSRPGTLVLIDDTPGDPWRIPRRLTAARRAATRIHLQRGYPPGKGAAVLKSLEHSGRAEVVWQHYNVLLRIV